MADPKLTPACVHPAYTEDALIQIAANHLGCQREQKVQHSLAVHALKQLEVSILQACCVGLQRAAQASLTADAWAACHASLHACLNRALPLVEGLL